MKKIVKRLPIGIFFLATLFFTHHLYAQKQLVVLKRGAVVARYNPGDDIVFKKKGSKEKIVTYVNNLSDTAIVTHNEVVPFHQIERMYFRQHSVAHTLGAVLVIGGVGYFLIDQVNNVIVHGNTPQWEGAVNRVSVPTLAIGLPLVLIRKKSQVIGYRYRILMVTEGSPFYRGNSSKGYSSPYIPR